MSERTEWGYLHGYGPRWADPERRPQDVTKTIRFTVPGVPRGQGRPRFARIGAHVRTYDPVESRSYKASIAQFAQVEGMRPFAGPVVVEISAYLPRPKRLCRRTDAPAPIPAPVRPDWDNLGKAVCDALIGVAYADDAQVTYAQVEKWYHERGGVPRLEVAVTGNVSTEG